MKANVKPTAANKLFVRGVELDFDAMNEHDMLKWQQVGEEVEKQYPDAMGLPGLVSGLDMIEDLPKKMAEGTAAVVLLFTGVFGADACTALLGEKPCYRGCMEAYKDILAAVEKQVKAYAQQEVKHMKKYTPQGPSGNDSI